MKPEFLQENHYFLLGLLINKRNKYIGNLFGSLGSENLCIQRAQNNINKFKQMDKKSMTAYHMHGILPP